MELDAKKSGNNLVVVINAINPSTGISQAVINATAYFLILNSAGTSLVSHASLQPQALAQQLGLTGIWACVVDVTSIDITDLIVVVRADIGGNTWTRMRVLNNTLLGPPRITATAGPVVDDAKNPVA